jgi:hypothetical protein
LDQKSLISLSHRCGATPSLRRHPIDRSNVVQIF